MEEDKFPTKGGVNQGTWLKEKIQGEGSIIVPPAEGEGYLRGPLGRTPSRRKKSRKKEKEK